MFSGQWTWSSSLRSGLCVWSCTQHCSSPCRILAYRTSHVLRCFLTFPFELRFLHILLCFGPFLYAQDLAGWISLWTLQAAPEVKPERLHYFCAMGQNRNGSILANVLYLELRNWAALPIVLSNSLLWDFALLVHGTSGICFATSTLATSFCDSRQILCTDKGGHLLLIPLPSSTNFVQWDNWYEVNLHSAVCSLVYYDGERKRWLWSCSLWLIAPPFRGTSITLAVLVTRLTALVNQSQTTWTLYSRT